MTYNMILYFIDVIHTGIWYLDFLPLLFAPIIIRISTKSKLSTTEAKKIDSSWLLLELF